MEARVRRRNRAAVAARLIARAPEKVAAVEWEMLDRAPEWLALPDAALGSFCARVGAVQLAPTMRLWIDGARIAAARAAIGDAYLQAVLADAPNTPHAVQPPIPAADVRRALTAAGAGVLIAAFPPGPMREAVGATFAPIEAAPMVPDLAQAIVARAQTLSERHQ